MKRILVVDDDRRAGEALREIFMGQGWDAQAVQTPEQAAEAFAQTEFDLVVSDINLEAATTGFDLLSGFRAKCPVILITGFGTLEAAIRASREGAWDLISKPFKVADVISAANRALEHGTGQRSREKFPESFSEPPGLIGRSSAMIELYKEIARVAQSSSTVLIIGESGVGKELVARSVHQHSRSAQGPFVAVNCGALAETLLEAELFGYVRGAFTGAVGDRRGLWEEAERGTLFLDEIGETSPAMQVKLLRALQEHEIRRVGSTRTIHVDVRVVAATNRDLRKEVERGSFRQDLFYRLSVFTLYVPTLRSRRGDIPLLAHRFLRVASEAASRQGLVIGEETMQMLAAYDWPGNVRELESAIEYAALHARGDEIKPEDLPPALQSDEVRTAAASRSPIAGLFDDLPTLDELDRRYLLHVLGAVDWSRTRAAAVMGIDRRTLYRMAERFGIVLGEGDRDNPGA
ncbi:MAG: sigma-54-dependent Fis family transcriptional regulator [Blastocatellales bacterium]|nr:sigma-54-dependent Fis family transcriptional regulator [Blastocatellales bacterium]